MKIRSENGKRLLKALTNNLQVNRLNLSDFAFARYIKLFHFKYGCRMSGLYPILCDTCHLICVRSLFFLFLFWFSDDWCWTVAQDISYFWSTKFAAGSACDSPLTIRLYLMIRNKRKKIKRTEFVSIISIYSVDVIVIIINKSEFGQFEKRRSILKRFLSSSFQHSNSNLR